VKTDHKDNAVLMLTCESGLETNPEAAQHDFTYTLIRQHGSFRRQHQCPQNLQWICITNKHFSFNSWWTSTCRRRET